MVEIDAIRALLGSKPRPIGWSERRQRLDEVGSTWPVAPDVQCEPVDCGVAGDSAGGNLTLGLISRLRAAGEPLPACAWLISPWTDLTMSGSSLATKDAID